MSNFLCDGCSSQIPPQNPRFHCQICPDYDSCANCHALGSIGGSHAAHHQMSLFRMSGTHTSGFADGQRSMNYQQPGPPPFQQQQQQQQRQHNGYGQNQPPISGGGWTPLYSYDGTPTPIFMTMMQQLFACLDPQRTGYVGPEMYSSFLEAQGVPPQHNICRSIPTLLHKNELFPYFQEGKVI
jgi:hypothetical protein